jgi:AcrR family transcriptional regulator
LPSLNESVPKRPQLLTREDLPAAPVQKRSHQKRDRLKAAALALFGEKGYEKTSIEDIAGRAQLAVGGFYQHFRSKRQLLVVLMDEFLERLGGVDLAPGSFADPRAGLRDLLARAFARDFYYLGAYRAWQEAMLADAGLARKNAAIHAWTTTRVLAVFQFLCKFPNTRPGVNLPALARSMDAFFWSLLSRALHMPKPELDLWIDSATHLIYHALFTDPQ